MAADGADYSNGYRFAADQDIMTWAIEGDAVNGDVNVFPRRMTLAGAFNSFTTTAVLVTASLLSFF